MRLIIAILIIIYCKELLARNVTFESFNYSPEESDLIDYGNLKFKKGKNKSMYTLNGNFSIKRKMGNEKLVTIDIFNGAGNLLAKNTHVFCEFMRVEKIFWPELVKSSSMPQDNPCPFPPVSLFKVSLTLTKMFISQSGHIRYPKICSQ